MLKSQHLKLIEELKQSVGKENKQLAQTLRLLAEIAEQRIHLSQGYSSLYQFCLGELCLSEGSIYRRTQVASKIKQYPLLLTMIGESRINLTVASLICPHLDRQKDAGLFLEKFVGKTKRAAEDLLIDKKAPRPAPKDDVRRLPDRELPRQPSMGLVLVSQDPSPKEKLPSLDNARDRLEPIREKCYQFNFAASERLKLKLEHLKDLMAHKYPAGHLENIIEEAVDHLIELKTPKAKRKNPPSPKPSHGRYIAVTLEEQVFTRSGRCCEYIGANGKRCNSSKFLQIDHRIPLSLGGLTELGNLQVLCAAHNQHKARCDHGAEFIEERIAQRS